jgi:hypothetical protein
MASSAPRRLVPPKPPADFAALDLRPVAPRVTSLFRICHRRNADPLHWSRSGAYRFDSPAARWGVCYAAETIGTAVIEVWGDAFRQKRVPFAELDERRVWKIEIPPALRVLRLAGETLPRIRATAQCFVSRYSLSQEWGVAFMAHPAELDGVIYLGRQSGSPCLALFGSDETPRSFQASLRATALGKLTEWEGFYGFLDAAGVRVLGLPPRPSRQSWGA